jgi:DNA-directed RNA polymerase, mitochondrial
MSCDFRGRVYPLAYLNYGRGDYVRALFRFAKGARIGERGIYWLKVATANTFNEKKRIARLPFDERVAWTEENLPRIAAVAAHPMSGLLTGELEGWLESASDPFQFVAHAIELTRALKVGEKFKTTLPIAFDASNSGAQQYSLLTRDPHGARLTNLVSDDPNKVEDLYEEVLAVIERYFTVLVDEARKISSVDEQCRWAMWLRSKEVLTRKVVKGLVVAFLYGQQEQETAKKILKALELKKADLPEGLLGWFVPLVVDAMEKTLPGAVAVMNYARDTARILARKNRPFRTISPSGVPVCTIEYKPDLKRPQMWLGFRESPRRHWAVVKDLDEVDVAACVRGAPANLVHSLDASHLAFVALACEGAGIPLACVHDSFATLACHAEELREILLRELRGMYEDRNPLQEIYDYARSVAGPKGLPSVPPLKSLDLDQVTGPYAFS